MPSAVAGDDGQRGRRCCAGFPRYGDAYGARSDPRPEPPPVARPTPVVAPAGMRLVGLGRAAIAVPVAWGTNKIHCGVPKRDTVVIDVGAVLSCLTPRPRGVESVELWQGCPRFDFRADATRRIDGVTGQRQRTTCERDAFDAEVCAGTVYLPSLRVSFRAESSSVPAQVNRILRRIRIVPTAVGVPGFQTAAVDRGRARYGEALRKLGLTAEVRTRRVSAGKPGMVLAVTPSPGTMLQRGASVAVTVVAEPEGPRDEVRVDVNSRSEEDEYRGLSDEQIRSG